MIIQSKKVWIADQFISAAVELEQGKITGIFPYGEKQADVDYGSKRIVPGFMDIHCHGAYEFDTNDAKPEGLRYWAKHIVSEGVTSFSGHYRHPERGGADQRRGQCGRRDGGQLRRCRDPWHPL